MGPALTWKATEDCKPNVTFSGFNISQKADCLKNIKQNNLPQMDGCSKKCTPAGITCCDALWIPSLTIPNVILYPQDRYQTESIFFFGDYSTDASAVDRESIVEGTLSHTCSVATRMLFLPPSLCCRTLCSALLRPCPPKAALHFKFWHICPSVTSKAPHLLSLPSSLPLPRSPSLSLPISLSPSPHRAGTFSSPFTFRRFPFDSQVGNTPRPLSTPSLHALSPRLVSTHRLPRGGLRARFALSLFPDFPPLPCVPPPPPQILRLVVAVEGSGEFYLVGSNSGRQSEQGGGQLGGGGGTYVNDELPRTSAITNFGYLMIVSYIVIWLCTMETLVAFCIAERIEKNVQELVQDTLPPALSFKRPAADKAAGEKLMGGGEDIDSNDPEAIAEAAAERRAAAAEEKQKKNVPGLLHGPPNKHFALYPLQASSSPRLDTHTWYDVASASPHRPRFPCDSRDPTLRALPHSRMPSSPARPLVAQCFPRRKRFPSSRSLPSSPTLTLASHAYPRHPRLPASPALTRVIPTYPRFPRVPAFPALTLGHQRFPASSPLARVSRSFPRVNRLPKSPSFFPRRLRCFSTPSPPVVASVSPIHTHFPLFPMSTQVATPRR
ncbi:unnamed protein product [Closterium sp. NIES-54]